LSERPSRQKIKFAVKNWISIAKAVRFGITVQAALLAIAAKPHASHH
jgi:hypothetical protein